MNAIKNLYDMHLACFGCGRFSPHPTPPALKIAHNDRSQKSNPEHVSFQAFSFLFELCTLSKTWSLRAANLNSTDGICPQMKTQFHWVSKKREVIQIASAQTAKTFAKSTQLPLAWVAQASRGSVLLHSWGCFPHPACNLPCTLLGGESSSPNYWANLQELKLGQQRPTEGQLKETAPSKATIWVLPSLLISHQTAREGKGRHPR